MHGSAAGAGRTGGDRQAGRRTAFRALPSQPAWTFVTKSFPLAPKRGLATHLRRNRRAHDLTVAQPAVTHTLVGRVLAQSCQMRCWPKCGRTFNCLSFYSLFLVKYTYILLEHRSAGACGDSGEKREAHRGGGRAWREMQNYTCITKLHAEAWR
jgi:hypothetical protein